MSYNQRYKYRRDIKALKKYLKRKYRYLIKKVILFEDYDNVIKRVKNRKDIYPDYSKYYWKDKKIYWKDYYE